MTVERAGESVVLKPKRRLSHRWRLEQPHTPSPAPSALPAYNSIPAVSERGQLGEKRCIVLGTGTSAMICTDREHGAEVTMLQRASTTVVRSETLMELGIGSLYSEAALAAGITTERADLLDASMPFALKHMGGQALTRQIKERDANFYARLAAAGFQLDFGEDESGLGMKAVAMAVASTSGASDLIIAGEIKLRSGVTIERIKERGVVIATAVNCPLISLSTPPAIMPPIRASPS